MQDRRRRATDVPTGAEVRIGERSSPRRQLLQRMLIGVMLLAFVTFITIIERDGYNDVVDGHVSLLDALYYATVAITTTGYGDIAPVSDEARLATTILVTPARIAFLVLLVGTSVELIASATREHLRIDLWRRRVRQHIVIAGFGVKGQAAAKSLVEQGIDPHDIVVIDDAHSAINLAVKAGHVAVNGDMTRNDVLTEAAVDKARLVIIAANRDDTAVLTTLSVRHMNAQARVVASVRELENASLLRRSGADSVLTSAGATGQLLGLASLSPNALDIVEDLLHVGEGLDITERQVQVSEPATISQLPHREGELIVAVYRSGELIARLPGGSQAIEPGDTLVTLVTAGSALADTATASG